MLDAILFAVRDNLRAQNFGYGSADLCELMDSGMPPSRCGNLFVSVHPGSTNNTGNASTRNLDERFDFSLTLTQRVTGIPLDRVGDQLLASKLARKVGPGNPSFNARLEQLRGWCHMNWRATVTTGLPGPNSANDNLIAWAPAGTVSVYGFIEPARYRGAERPTLVGGEWFGADPSAQDLGLKAELRFGDARRMQPQTASVGVFV